MSSQIFDFAKKTPVSSSGKKEYVLEAASHLMKMQACVNQDHKHIDVV